MPNCVDRLDRFDPNVERDFLREFQCVCAVVLVGCSLGALFVYIREVLGLKM
jgi:hypothetical protein